MITDSKKRRISNDVVYALRTAVQNVYGNEEAQFAMLHLQVAAAEMALTIAKSAAAAPTGDIGPIEIATEMAPTDGPPIPVMRSAKLVNMDTGEEINVSMKGDA